MDVASQASTALSGKTIQKKANFRSFQLNYSIVVPSDLLCGKSLEGSITTKPQVQLRNRVRNWAPSFICSQEWHRPSCLLLLGLLCWFHFLFWTEPRILLTSSLPDLIGSHRLTTFCFQGLPNCYLSPDLPPAFQTCLFNCLLHLSAQMALWHLDRRTCRTDLLRFLFNLFNSVTNRIFQVPCLCPSQVTCNPSTNPVNFPFKIYASDNLPSALLRAEA